MLSEAEAGGVLQLLDRVSSHDARKAFILFLSTFFETGGLSSAPGDHGHIKDFRVEFEGKNCFAFTANKDWLLCYFRNPAMSYGWFDRNIIRDLFPEVEDTPNGELKLRVKSYDQARAVVDYVTKQLR